MPSDAGARLACAALAWLAGAALQLQQAALWPPWWYVAMACVGLGGLVVGARSRRLWPIAIASAALMAFGATGWRAADRLSETLASELEGQDVQLTGIVASLPHFGSTGVRFRFDVEHASWRGTAAQVPQQISLGWYRGWQDDGLFAGPQDELRAGERWRFTVRLRQPHGQLNPHGFDYELWLFEQGVRATGYVRATRDAPALRLAAAAGYPIERLRQRVRDAIYVNVADRRAAGVLAALAVGDQAAIERDDWDLFRNTGVAHLMSISGLHVTMFAWLAGLLIGALWRRAGTLSLALPTPLAARFGGLLAATAYALFSGWGVPAQRTVWMLATATLLIGLGRRWPWPLVLLAAAWVVSALDPWALLQPGFWLSFVAVGLLMASEPEHLAVLKASMTPADEPAWRRALGSLARHARSGLRTQVVATLGLAPLTLVFFQQVSLVGLFANLVAIPLVTLLITPLALLGVAATPLWSAGAWITQQLAHGLEALAALPGAVWTAAAAPAWAQAAGLVAGALAVLPLPRRLRLLAVPLVLPLLLTTPERPREGSFDLLAADIGQGTAVLLRTRSHALIYDVGPQYSRDNDAGHRVLLPLLRARGERHIDRLVLSHRDADHVGGAATLLRALPIDELWSSLEHGHPLLAQSDKTTRCEAGQAWTWDGVHFEVLHPAPADYTRGLKSNALSCVLRVSNAKHSALLTGDIERDQELALVAAHGAALRTELLLVPHHGSRTSSTPAFLDAVEPSVAVMQAGYRNRFGHPAPDVLARYDERGIGVVVSPACGAFEWSEGRGICERNRSRRYWHHPGDGTLPRDLP
jgi:competence protein ComEC